MVSTDRLVNSPDCGMEGDMFTIIESLLNHPREQALKIKGHKITYTVIIIIMCEPLLTATPE